MSQFSKMEQAERWVVRLEGEAVLLVEKGKHDQAMEHEEAADDLKRVISKVRYGCADTDDWKVFNAAVAARDLRDLLVVS